MYDEIEILPDSVLATLRCDPQSTEPLGAYAHKDAVRYLFLRPGGVRCLTAKTTSSPLPSLSPEMPLYDWHEREMLQKCGIVFEGQPDLRPLFIEGGLVPEALTAEGQGISVVVVGPVHAGVIEPGRFTITTGGETVVHLDAQFSYAHRDIQRAFTGRDALEIAPLVGRICGGCTVARSWAYARALECIAGVECDEPTEYARVVLAELERLHNHVFDLANAASGAGYGRGLTIGLGLKEQILRLCNEAARHRLMFDALVPGGVRFGVLREPETLRASLALLKSSIDRFTNELFENRSVLRRFEGAGFVDPETARLFGTCGPTRRASGGKLDVRSFASYGAYRGLDVSPATSGAGDVLARCSVKRDEISESLRLIEVSLERLDGRVPAAPQVLWLGEGRVTTAVEGPRGTETVSVEIASRGTIDRFHAISASYRNWPVVARAMEDNIMPDFPLVNKSFNLCYSCMDR